MIQTTDDNMTQGKILVMARQVGYTPFEALKWEQALTDFAKLVRNDYSNKHAQLWLKRIDDAVKAEREACAKVCEDLDLSDWQDRGWDQGTYDCANAIRARSKATLRGQQ